MGSDQKRAFLAVILSGIVLFTWQAFFAPKPNNNNNFNTQKTSLENTSSSTTSKSDDVVINQNKGKEVVVNESLENFVLSSNGHEFTVNNNLEIINVKSVDAVFNYDSIVGEKSLTGIELLTGASVQKVYFTFEPQQNSNSLIGSNSKYNIKIFLNVTDDGKLQYRLVSNQPYQYVFKLKTDKKELENTQLRKFGYFSNDVDFNDVGSSFTLDDKVKWFGIDFNFHLFSFIFNEKQSVKLSATEEGLLTTKLVSPVTELKGEIVFTKKNYDRLVKLGSNLDLSVDFGILGVLAVPILRALQFFYKYIPNYGVAIILLTLLIRLITFPLQYKSFKSMKKMQKIQPELNKLKEKFKDDPQRMQKETMELFKRAGANPLGGCFPLLLQMPIFFAFYKVLYAAVELVGAPFFGWIQDLSIKDPYFVLPVIMAVTMFLQQKLNPSTTADPTQQKIMMAMPLIFGFIMKDLPSGLVLYICVSTIFGIIQQLFVYKTTD